MKILLTAAACTLLGLACRDADTSPASSPASSSPASSLTSAAAPSRPLSAQARATNSEPERDARADHPPSLFFGDLHVHSGWSIDAWSTGVRADPVEAYKYARGEPIAHSAGYEMRIQGPPLDFIAVTDHAEYLGVTRAVFQANHPLRKQPLIKTWLGKDRKFAAQAWARIRETFLSRVALPALVSDEVLKPAWQEAVGIANRFNAPGEFTTLIGFEYSSNPKGQNLHRNVLFRGDDVPDRPFSAMDSLDPADLWAWMDRARAEGDDVLAIPHNANGSNGLMFSAREHAGPGSEAHDRSKGDDSSRFDAEWLALRERNEMLAEIFQVKGQSETAPTLSPEDPWADFEVIPWRTADPNLASQAEGSYWRDALRRGLAIEAESGINPFALGAVGSTDGHNAASPFQEANFTGKLGASDGTAEQRLAVNPPNPDGSPSRIRMPTLWGAAGLAGVWADQNTRAGLFDALKRRETFATSGPRIGLRFFAGWDFRATDTHTDLPRAGYARGVPMGSQLERTPREAQAEPTFLLSATRDPLEAKLERLQVIKGWFAEGRSHERIFDVACGDGAAPAPDTHRCPHSATSPDLGTCTPTQADSASTLVAAWRDPEPTPNASAFYYARVLQVPTCRWSTFDANRLGIAPPTGLPAAIQERAVSSPIWVPAAQQSGN
ncbi:MAG: DUF3604 domain-containing protein [Myxococcota bacterium]